MQNLLLFTHIQPMFNYKQIMNFYEFMEYLNM